MEIYYLGKVSNISLKLVVFSTKKIDLSNLILCIIIL